MFKKKIIFFILVFQLSIIELEARDYLIVQSTTSANNSGIIDVIEKSFEEKYEIDLRFVSVGSGQAIKNGKNGDGDLLFVHSKDDEINFIKAGYGLERFEIMHNDFVIIGPTHDPAGLRNVSSVVEAMLKLKLTNSYFLSRNDNSGTHKKELFLWELANIKINNKDKWYLRNGLGMGATLNMASEIGAYTLSDRGTWLAFNNKKYLDVLFDEDEILRNYYSAIPLNPKKFPYVEYKKTMIFIEWLLAKEGKAIINNFKINDQQLFFTK